MGDEGLLIRPQDQALAILAILTVFFLIVGLVQAFEAPSRSRRHRRRRRRQRLVPRKANAREKSGTAAGRSETLPVMRGQAQTQTVFPPPRAGPSGKEKPGVRASPERATASRKETSRRVVELFRRALAGQDDARRQIIEQRADEKLPSERLRTFREILLHQEKMVVRFTDGRVIEGYSYDFYPTKTSFHLFPAVSECPDEPIEVHIKDLRVVFFVRDYAGDRSYNEHKEFMEGERPARRKIEVTFMDGEVLVGSTISYHPGNPGFSFVPADPKSNNLRVFAVFTAVVKVRFL